MQMSATFHAGKGGQRQTIFALTLAALGVAGFTPAKAATCEPETLSSILFSQQVPVELFSNPNGSPLATAEVDEIQATVLNIRSTLGAISSLAAIKNPTIPRSLDITVGANVGARGYSFSPKTYAAQTTKAGNVIITFATDIEAASCKVFWMRVSMPVSNTDPKKKEDDSARNGFTTTTFNS